MTRLYVLYDGHCGLCRQAKQWLEREPVCVPLVLIPSGSEEAVRRFPEVVTDDLAVISDAGQVWTGDRAFLMCLWALRDYRDWSRRLSAPALLPLARQAFALISSGRFAVSALFGLRSEAELALRLRAVPVEVCELGEHR